MYANQRTLLFLIADTGAGHRSAANAIRNAITLISQQEQEEWHQNQQQLTGAAGVTQLAPSTYRIEIIDVFEEYSRFPVREAVKLYGPAIRYNPKLYGHLFHLSNKERRIRAVESVANPLIQHGLQRLITEVQPDVIVSIHPLLNYVTIKALCHLGLSIPFLTVVTDLVSVHHAWFAKGADAYIIPTEQAQQLYLMRGLDPQRVHLLGMPIDPKFTRPAGSKEELRQTFGLAPSLPVILLVGGGEGSGGLLDAVRAISRARLPVQLLIVTGRNRRLYAHLQRVRSSLHVSAKVFGFVQNMPELMRASDVIVTKAGPGSICEAIACELPIVLSGYVPGQEEGNVEFVLANDLGVLAHDSLELVDAIRRLVNPGSPVMQRQLANARRLRRPDASFDIARCILSFLPPAGETSNWRTGAWPIRRRRTLGPLRPEVRIRALRRRLPHVQRAAIIRSPVVRRVRRLSKFPASQLSRRLSRLLRANRNRTQ